jgi:pimeloyl-ACP methyl ester carboxylesterase
VVDARLTLRDGRILAWHDWGVPDGSPLLRLQGTPGSRMWHEGRPALWEQFGLRVIMADRPGFGASTRRPGRGVADVADDLVQLLDHLGLERVPVMAVSGGWPHLARCARGIPSELASR